MNTYNIGTLPINVENNFRLVPTICSRLGSVVETRSPDTNHLTTKFGKLIIYYLMN